VEVEPPALTHRRIALAYCALMLGMLLASLDETILATAMPTIVSDVGDLDRLAWVVTAYIAAATIAAPIFGKLGDLYGRKLLFQAAIVVFLAGSLLCALCQDLTQLVACRIVQGFGAGGLIVGSQAVTGDLVAPRQRGRYLGYVGGTFAIASIAGPPLGGLFVDQLSWRWIFLANLPLGVIALLVVALVLPGHADRVPQPVDLIGVVLLSASLGPLTLALTLGGVEYAWDSPTIVALFSVGLAMLALFVLRERAAPDPLVPLALFHNRVFAAMTVAGFLVNLARWSAIVYLPLYLQVVQGVSPTSSGLRLLPLVGAVFVASLVGGRAITRLGRYKPFTVGGTGLVTIGLYLLSRLDAGTSSLMLTLSMLVLGVGLGLVLQVFVLAVQNAVEWRDLGVATSTASFVRLIGASFGVAIFGTTFAGRLAYWQPRAEVVDAFSHALHSVFLLAIPFGAAAFVVTLLAREIPLRETRRTELALASGAVSRARPAP
jgi:EmrB/QacA subfamily drug resistance transporter